MAQALRVPYARFASVGLFPSRFLLPTPQRAIQPRDTSAKKIDTRAIFSGWKCLFFRKMRF
jgi:hypothetical protein